MNTKAIVTILPITFGFVVAGVYGMLTRPCAAANGALPEPAAAVSGQSGAESSTRVDMKSLAKKLEFLGDKPVLAGHPVLIEFWATWCPPCRASIAHLNDLSKTYHDRGLEIIGIADEDKSVVEGFRARTPMHYDVALDVNQALAAEFQVQAIPQAWLFDKDGRIVWSGHPMQLDEQTIARALPTPSAS